MTTSKRFNASRLRQLLRRNRAMLQKLSENPDLLINLAESDWNELIDLKQENNAEIESENHEKP